MIILKKRKKNYAVTEYKKVWAVTEMKLAHEQTGLEIVYRIQKDIAPTVDDLNRYIEDSDMF